jgi:uncharacterized surface protein with fasciclin (FAS1) repeats
MKKYFTISKSVLLAAALVVLGSCKDAWNDHYSFKETESKYPVDKLAETLKLKADDGFSNFYEALRTTKMCDKHGRPIDITYLELLEEDQFLTVWAPSNSSIQDWSLYTKKNKTNAEHKEVGEKFLMNHIARFKHSVGEGTNEKVYMMNGKPYRSLADGISGQSYHGDDKNIRCSNGVLHFIDGYLDYLPNLYQFLTTDSRYKDLIGNWFKSYTIQELDTENSVSQGVNENGEMVYVDSVMIESSILLEAFGYINSEDSTYSLVLPTPELWTGLYNRISQHFLYKEDGLNNDSLQKFYTYATIMSDMFFNMNKKSNIYLPDSIYSTQYYAYDNRRDNKPYHIFGKPYQANGIFGSSIDSVVCSNGVAYILNQWPVTDDLSFLRPITLEAEDYNGDLSRFTVQYANIKADYDGTDYLTSLKVMRLSMKGMDKWDASFYIGNTLRGKYKIKMVVSPNLLTSVPDGHGGSTYLPFKIHPSILFDTPTMYDSVLVDSTGYDTVYNSKGIPRLVAAPFMIYNNVNKLSDTIELGIVDIPYSSYDMEQSRLQIKLSSKVENTSKNTSELWLDCFILEPVVE